MKIYKYYVIMKELDQNDGSGGLSETTYCFERYSDALEFTKSKEMSEFTVMGYVRPEGHKELIKEKIINSFENISECVQSIKDNLRKQALSKLSKYEKEILGLVDL